MDPQKIAIQQNISVGLLLAEPAQIDYFGCMGTITADTIIFLCCQITFSRQTLAIDDQENVSRDLKRKRILLASTFK